MKTNSKISSVDGYRNGSSIDRKREFSQLVHLAPCEGWEQGRGSSVSYAHMAIKISRGIEVLFRNGRQPEVNVPRMIRNTFLLVSENKEGL